MTLLDVEAKNFEFALDIFKGTCLLNDYKVVLGEGSLENAINSTKEKGGYFYYRVSDTVELGAFLKKIDSEFKKSELVNLAVKILNNMGIYDLRVRINDEKVVENLKLVDIEIEKSDVKKEEFQIVLNGQVLAEGKFQNDISFFKIDYEDIKGLVVYDSKDELDLLVLPLEKEVFSDAFAISTNLKDAGFSVRVDYSLKKLDELEHVSAFVISFDRKDIEKYTVKFRDTHTNEEKEVMIDNIIEELSFF